jgi:exodeoxyribonuclease V alpha subunit
VLGDVIASGKAPVTLLDVIFRQSSRSTIVHWAHSINHGRVPPLPERSAELSDLYFVEKEEPEEILRLILTLCTERIPERFKFDPVRDVQVLSPMHKGVLGVSNLNEQLRAALNPRRNTDRQSPGGLHEGDKVMQIRNNYDKEVFNGDIGFISTIDPVDAKLTVRFDDREVEYQFSSLNEIVPAYAISVHKSQGTEYPAVVLPLVTQHFVLLHRNLLYTAITRARKLVVLVGTQRALRIAVQQEMGRSRYTGLCERLKNPKRPDF